MSLVMGVSVRDEFIILSGDTKITTGTYDRDNFEKSSKEVKETGLNHEKVFPITRQVLFSTAGNVHVGDIVKAELIKRIKPDDTLEECAEALFFRFF